MPSLEYALKLFTTIFTEKTLLAAVCTAIIISSLLGFMSHRLTYVFILDCAKKPSLRYTWQIITYALLHQNLVHLTGNIASLISLGLPVFKLVGGIMFIKIFFAGIILPSLSVILLPFLKGSCNYFLGASNGVTALIGALAILKPSSTLLFFYAFPVTMSEAFVGLIIVSFAFHVTGIFKSVWHLGHALGAIAGATIVLI